MFELRPFERRNNRMANYDPWSEMERAFWGDGAWSHGLSEFKTDIQDKGDSYLLEADLPGFKKEDIHVDLVGEEELKKSRIKYLTVAPMFAEAIERTYQEISIAKLFN